MPPQTLKMLLLFFLAAALLNLTNYISYRFYEPPANKAVKLHVQVHAPRTRRFLARRRVTRTLNWTASLQCANRRKGNGDSIHRSTSETSPLIDFLADYKSQTTETNPYYYYNGIRMGPLMCPVEPPGLGPIKPNERVSLEAIENLYSSLQPGGIYEEMSCTPWQTVAVIVPCREHSKQVTEFLYSLLPILIKQQLEFRVFLIQPGNKTQPLNRGKLMNVGFTEAQRMKKNGGWRCIVFHHHSLVPVDSRNLYRCSDQPRQLAVSLDSNQSLPFGGAIAIKPPHFLKVNGFSNLYVGNDAVDDDFAKRLIDTKLSLTKNNATISHYTLLPGTDDIGTISGNNVSQTIQTSSPLNLLDGLSTLSYNLVTLDLRALYTLIEVDLEGESSSPTSVLGEKLWDKLLNQATSSQRTEQAFVKNSTWKKI